MSSDTQEPCDAFISYVEEDKDWVVDNLIKNLEQDGFQIYWDDRDFELGKTVLKNKLEALLGSRKIIVVFSPNYVAEENVWDVLSEENSISLTEVVHHFSIIPIIYRPCKIPEHFKDLFSLDWTNAHARKFFWKKLAASLEKNVPNSSKGMCNYSADLNDFSF